MTSYVTPKKNAPFVFYVSLEDKANAGLFKASPTLAAGDVLVSTDDAAPANIATLPVVDADFTKRVKVSLSAEEMNGDNVTLIFSDAAGAEWYDLIVNIQTSARQIDDLAFPTTSGRSLDVSATGEAGIDWSNVGSPTTSVDLSGTTVGAVTALGTDAVSAAALSAAAVDEILDEVVEGSTTIRQLLRGFAAVLLGKSTNSGANYRDLADSKTRVDATLDGSGNRTAVTLDLT